MVTNENDPAVIGGSSGEAALLHADSQDLIYYSDDSVDSTLQKLVDLLNIPEFSVNQLSVKRVIPGQKKSIHCFDFSPLEVPIVDRVSNECGPGSYEVWVRNEKKEIHKRLKLNVSQDEATGARQGARRSRGGRSRGGQQNRGGGGHHGGGNQGMQQELESLRNQISAMQTGVQAPTNTGTGITHTDLIDAEERGYKRAKDNFDIQLSAIKEHHETQLTMIKESKGTERYLDDQEDDEDPGMSTIVQGLAAAMAPSVEAFSEGYRTQKETENIIARQNAGLPPEPEMEPEEPEDGVKAGESEPNAKQETFNPVGQKVFETVTALFAAAAAGESTHDHADAILRSFDKQTVDNVFLSQDTIDGLFSQRKDLVQYRPWFESLVKDMRSIIARIHAERLAAEKSTNESVPKKPSVDTNDKNTAHKKETTTTKADTGDKGVHEARENKDKNTEESREKH